MDAEDIEDCLAGLSADELARLTDSHVTTARRWLRTKKAPPMVLRCLAVLRRGDLGAVNKAWTGWRLSARDGELYSPEGSDSLPATFARVPCMHRRPGATRSASRGHSNGGRGPGPARAH